MTAMRCRVERDGDECGNAAAVGIVTTSVDVDDQDILEFFPVCIEHAPEETDELSKAASPEEWAVVTLAYGQVGELT